MNKKNINKKISVTVAVATYNAEKNMSRLLTSLLKQKETSYFMEKIVINSDTSTDDTVKIAKGFKNKKIRVIDSKERLGFAGSLIKLVKSNRSDVLILLNDDVIITDNLFVEKTAKPFIDFPSLGLACCNPQPLPSGSFIAGAVRSGYVPYKKISEETRGGHNVFTVDGKALCFSKAFTEKIVFPEDYSIMGNVDKYIYFSCISKKFQYRYVKEAILFFKCPQTVSDFINWQTRNYKSNKYLVYKAWGSLVEKEYQMSNWKFRFYKLIELIKNPLESLVIFLLGLYSSYKARTESRVFNIKWNLVGSTKDL